MVKSKEQNLLDKMIEELDLPEYVIEQSIRRYKSLGEWFDREGGLFEDVSMEVFPQGSFALGTTIRPIEEKEEYDLDIGCKVKSGDYKSLHAQKHLKESLGIELEAYRKAKGIKGKMEPKHRCWRLEYQDEINFHMDIVPCIPMGNEERKIYEKRINEFYQYQDGLSEDVTKFAINITDDRHHDYEVISSEWPASNPQGYLRWFQSRMNSSKSFILNERTSIIPIEVYKQKSILQRCIQLLKRHRDNMFGDDEKKPISIIITTLAARAYNGETDLSAALTNILETMPGYINSSSPRIPNPVNPAEDFSDRWEMPEAKELDLEGNFRIWLLQAKMDFKQILESSDENLRSRIINEKFSLNINNSVDLKRNDLGSKSAISAIKKLPENPPKPWGVNHQ
ncbi:nucleotidyltransferase domain-containing protein [Planococcus kocurii]|uniref:nucleotidyltransferase domain-containing protein n=1 Tax=Planococcus kocurii TaxID=1374 RepID=UPI003D05D23D